MIRNLKAMGLALVAVFALSAVGASAAQAASADFSAAEYSANVTGSGGLQVFQTSFGKLTCAEVTGTATLGAQGGSLTGENIAYGGCHATILKIPTTVDMNGCHYTFTAGTITAAGTSEGSVHIQGCNATGHITITVGTGGATCTIDVSEQTISPVTYHNTAGGTVDVRTNETPVQQVSTGGSACAGGESTSKYTGEIASTATHNGKADSLSIVST